MKGESYSRVLIRNGDLLEICWNIWKSIEMSDRNRYAWKFSGWDSTDGYPKPTKTMWLKKIWNKKFFVLTIHDFISLVEEMIKKVNSYNKYL